MTVVASKLSTILSAIKARLVSEGVYASNCVFIGKPTAEDGTALTPDKDYAVLTPGPQRAEQHENFLISGTVKLTLWNLLELDRAQWAELQLTDPSLGLLRKVDAAVSALNLHYLQSGGSEIVVEPMRFKDMSEAKETGQKDEWLRITLTFDIRWEWDVA